LLSSGFQLLSGFMQDFILDLRNKERVDRFKLALLNLERLDIEGEDLEVPIGGYVEPCFNQDQDWQLWGTLGWIQDWFVRPVQNKKQDWFVTSVHKKKKVNLLDYSNIRQSTLRKYTRRTPLSRLFHLQDARDFALCDFHIYEPFRVEREAWHEYIKDYLAKRRDRRLRGYPNCIYPTNKEVIDLLLKASTYTRSIPSYPFLTVLDSSQTVSTEDTAGENLVQ
jgi:hypothetical protein